MMKKRVLAIFGLIGLMGVGALYASNTKHFDHQSMHTETKSNFVNQVSTGGEAAFSEITRIVEILSNDKQTNWSKVNISALREHLVDMSNVTLNAKVSSEITPNGAKFYVVGNNSEVIQSIQNMAEAHGSMMNSERQFSWKETLKSDGAVVTVTSETNDGQTKIQALGFHGLLALGDHHSFHHLMLARGNSPH